jgi:hypothetical protein
LNPPGFIAWLDRLGSQSHLLNTTSRVQWNFDKQYLLQLRGKGKNVAPTAIITSVSEVAISQALQQSTRTGGHPE